MLGICSLLDVGIQALDVNPSTEASSDQGSALARRVPTWIEVTMAEP